MIRSCSFFKIEKSTLSYFLNAQRFTAVSEVRASSNGHGKVMQKIKGSNAEFIETPKNVRASQGQGMVSSLYAHVHISKPKRTAVEKWFLKLNFDLI